MAKLKLLQGGVGFATTTHVGVYFPKRAS